MTEIVIETRNGTLAGVAEAGITRFLGVPYARAARFEAPGPVAPWQGTRAADRFAKQCPQQFGGKVRRDVLESETYGEDCLYLNVFRPEGGSIGPKPVLVWIHGGAFLAGGSNAYDASRLAREGDIIVVTINYRIGVLGFVNFTDALGIPAIPSNIGLRDQIAALEWVRDNIADFGGDPGKVTICGQSAGSMSVSLLMLSPRARGLFHGAVMQSGAVSLIHDRERSIRDARRYAEALKLDQSSLQRLKTMDIAELIGAQAAVGKQLKNAIPAAPWYDGDVLPASFDEAVATPTAPVPLLAGATRDEVRLFDLMPGDILPTKWDDLKGLLRDQFGPEQTARILATYPRNRKGRIALGSDLTFVMPTRHFAERHAQGNPTWFYRFDYTHPLVGAAHGLDLTVFWPFSGLKMALVRGGPDKGRRAELGQRMRSHVAHFVRHGDPGDIWPRYEAATRKVRIYDLADSFAANPEAERYAAWAGRDVEPGRGK
ncbi:carboxylesterase family protein [Novosphingobium sp. BL-8A]|uniref:carboxylesterase/lipase family protein n=1 Tax=Novosphingobium sp. BL-8A TaxID=3127639 RepID=UPI0037582ED0